MSWLTVTPKTPTIGKQRVIRKDLSKIFRFSTTLDRKYQRAYVIETRPIREVI
jgi:hypothetical protein